MVYANPTPTIAQLQAQILAAAPLCVPTIGAVLAKQIHYPTCCFATDDATVVDQLPAMLLSESDPEFVRYAEGAGPLPKGQLLIMVYADSDVGTLEAWARSFCYQLMLQQTGFCFRSVNVKGEASDPTSGMRAIADSDQGQETFWRSIAILATYGLNA